MGKSTSSQSRQQRYKPYAVYKGKELEKHDRPDVCRQQIVDAFGKKIRTLPVGELGLLVVLPADKRGPVRVETHNMTIQQAAAAVKAINRTLPYPQDRLTNWVSGALKGQKPRKGRQQAGAFLLFNQTAAVTVAVTGSRQFTAPGCITPGGFLLVYCVLLPHATAHSGSSSDGSEAECRDTSDDDRGLQAQTRRQAAARTQHP